MLPSTRLAGLCASLLGLLVLPPVSSGQEAPAAGEHTEVLNGVPLWYKVSGHGQAGQAPVLFLHGGPGYNSYSFEKTIGARLEAHLQLIYLDERGSGRSARPARHDYRMATLVQDVEALRARLGVAQLSVMGHSFGGTIALEYAAAHPAHVRRLVIIDGASDMPQTLALWTAQLQAREPAAWRQVMQGPEGRALGEARGRADPCAVATAELNAQGAVLRAIDAQAFRNGQQFRDPRHLQEQEALDRESGLSNTGEIGAAYFGPGSTFPCYRFTAFPALTMPTLVIVGRYDGAIGVPPMRELAAHLPDARLLEFERSAHFPYAEEPDRFVHDVTGFLAPAGQ